MLPKVDELSVVENIFPNSFFESFDFQKTSTTLDATWNIKTSIRDFEKNNKFLWFNTPNINKYLHVNLALIRNKRLFDSLNQDNFISLLVLNNTPTQDVLASEIVIQTKRIVDFIGEEASTEDKQLEFSNNQENIKIYKFYYDWVFKRRIGFGPRGTFHGFITYVSFDVEQYKKDLNLQNFSDDINSKFILDKHVFFENFEVDGSTTANKIKKLVVRNIPATETSLSEDKIWYKKYLTIGDATLSGKLNGKDVLLKEIDVEIPVFERVLWSSNNLSVLTPNTTRPPTTFKDTTNPISRRILSKDNSLGEVFSAFDAEGDLKIIFLMDIGKLVLVNSSLAKYIRPESLRLFVEGDFMQYTIINSFTAKKRKIIDGSISYRGISGNMVENLRFATSTLGSLVKVIEIKDNDIKYEKTGKYEYTAEVKVQDGLVAYVDSLLATASEEIKLLQEYLKHSEYRSYEKNSDGTLKYFDEKTELFNDNFILEQQAPDSLWNKVNNSLTSFSILQEFFGYGVEVKKDSTNETFVSRQLIRDSVLPSLKPTNLKLNILEELIVSFENLINYSNKLIKTSNNKILTKEYVLLSNFEADNERYFYKLGVTSSSLKNFTNNPNYASNLPSRFPTSIVRKRYARQDFVSGFVNTLEQPLFDNFLNFKIDFSTGIIKNLLAEIYSKKDKVQNFLLSSKPGFFYEYMSKNRITKSIGDDFLGQFGELELLAIRIKPFATQQEKQTIINEIVGLFPGLSAFTQKMNSDLAFRQQVFTNPDVFLFAFIILSNFYMLEYVHALKNDYDDGYLIKGDALVWKRLNFPEISTIIPKGKSTIVRFRPVKFDGILRIPKEFDTHIINQYFILTNDT